MWFDDKESRWYHHGHGKKNQKTNIDQLLNLLFFRNMPISSEFHSSRHQLRTRLTLNRPSWQWRRKLRIALGHHPALQTRKAKLKLTRDVRLKAIRVDAVKLYFDRANAPSFIIIMHHPFPLQTMSLYVLSIYFLTSGAPNVLKEQHSFFFNSKGKFALDGIRKIKLVFYANRILFIISKVALPSK